MQMLPDLQTLLYFLFCEKLDLSLHLFITSTTGWRFIQQQEQTIFLESQKKILNLGKQFLRKMRQQKRHRTKSFFSVVILVLLIYCVVAVDNGVSVVVVRYC